MTGHDAARMLETGQLCGGIKREQCQWEVMH